MSRWWPQAAAGVAAAGVVLAQLVGVAMPPRLGLYTQAALILAFTGLVFTAALTESGWGHRLRSAPPALLAGVVCYAAAAVLGACVAVVRGNDAALLAGQLLSMSLIPAAAVAGFALPTTRRAFSAGLLAAVTAGGLIQLGWWAWSLLRGQLVDRMALPSSVSFVGPALLTLLIATVYLQVSKLRPLAWIAAGAATTLVVGSAVRGLWLVSVPALVLHLLIWRGGRWPMWRRALVVVAIAAGALTVVEVMAERTLSVPRPNLLPTTPTAFFTAGGLVSGLRPLPPAADPGGGVVLTLAATRRVVHVSQPIPLPGPGSYLLQVDARGRGTGAAVIVVEWLDSDGRSTRGIVVAIPADGVSRVVQGIGAPPDGTTAVVVRCLGTPGSAGQWYVTQLSLSRLGGPMLGLALRQRWAWHERIASLVRVVRQQDPGADPALAFRWRESSRLVEAIGTSGWRERFLGHGLGATVHLGVYGFDDRGNWVWHGDTNYVHNFYLFLLYKLGVLGTLLVLTALCLWVVWTLRRALAEQDLEARGFLAAAAAAWVGYSVWSLSSPEILDFRMAPLWGLLLAASATATSHPQHRRIGNRTNT